MEMETILALAIVGIIVMSVISFVIGKMMGHRGVSPEVVKSLEGRIGELKEKNLANEAKIAEQVTQITSLTSERNVQQAHADNALAQLDELRRQSEQQLAEQREMFEERMVTLSNFYDKQLQHVKEDSQQQLETLREMNKSQVDAQLDLIKEQMRTTSEDVLKARQEELDAQNKEQVSKIIDPLQKSLKDMEEALNNTKQQQHDALTRLDETIKLSMEKSASLGETADRLTRALTGEVKVQGNFGELKLKQLLEDLELKEGEQFDTQETLRDRAGRGAKDDEGKGLVPDFILHFPNNRHVVVDSKMSLTDYERYMNAEDGTAAKSGYLKAHIDSVRAQVKRLAKKDYTSYLPAGYNKLNFAIMYVPIEGALNLALFNDATLWREAYDEGVMILGPQTMYMNLRVLEMMWTQVRQLKNQQAMIEAANKVVERVQDFGGRFMEVEASMDDTIKKMRKLKILTSEHGPSIFTAAQNLLKAGAKENKKKKSLSEMEEVFIDDDPALYLSAGNNSYQSVEDDREDDGGKDVEQDAGRMIAGTGDVDNDHSGNGMADEDGC